MTGGKIWLDVPYAEKDEAKAQGAWWDSAARRWYAPKPGMTALDRWLALPDVPDLLVGEDRTFGSGLFVDLVPSSCWFTNVRSCVSQHDWERLRRMITTRAGQHCEACGRGLDRESGRWLEAHERWSYNASVNIQTLRRLICLCTDCHTTTHYGLAGINGKASEARQHLCTVMGMSQHDSQEHINAAFTLWRRRSLTEWGLDLSILTNAGITITQPPSARQRNTVAGQTLRQI
jgi:hypothetical protein